MRPAHTCTLLALLLLLLRVAPSTPSPTTTTPATPPPAASTPPPPPLPPGFHAASLRALLRGVTVPIGNETVVANEVVHGTLTDIVCGAIDLGPLDGELVPRHGDTVGYTLSATQLGFVCTTGYHFHVLKSKTEHRGEADIHASQTSLRLTLHLAFAPPSSPTPGLLTTATASDVRLRLSDAQLEVVAGHRELPKAVEDALALGLELALDLAVPGLVEKGVQTSLSAALTEFAGRIEPYLAPPEHHAAPAIVAGGEPTLDLGASTGLAAVDYFVDYLLSPSGQLGVNRLVGYLSGGTGAVVLRQPRLLADVAVGAGHRATAVLRALRVGGLSSFDEAGWAVLRPAGPNLVNTSVSLGHLAVGLELDVTLMALADLSAATETVHLTLNLSQPELAANVWLDVYENISRLGGGEAIVPGCLERVVANASTEFLWVGFGLEELRLGVASQTPGDADLNHALDDLVRLVADSYADAVPAALGGLLAEAGAAYLDDLYWNLTARPRQCSPLPADAQRPIYYTRVYVVLSFCLAWALATAVWVGLASRRAGRAAASGESRHLLQRPDARRADPGELRHLAVCCNPTVPGWLRVGVPVLIILTICLVAWANLAVGASVLMRVTVGDAVLELPSLFDFTLSNSVREMWEAQVYPLSLCIAVFSGAWPYVKLLCMYFAWMVPPATWRRRCCCLPSQERVLMFVDAYGKWSLIDAYVMTLMIVAFRFDLVIPAEEGEYPGQPPPDTRLTVYVKPGWGFYAFLMAAISSLVLCHVALYWLRECRTARPSETSRSAEALSKHHFRIGGRVLEFTALGRALIPLALVGIVAVIVMGARASSFQFDFRGVIADVLSFLQQRNPRVYSLISLGTELPTAALSRNNIGIRFIQAQFMVFSLFLPLVLPLAQLALWTLRLTAAAEKWLFMACEVITAWSALEVFVFSIIVALLELKKFAFFIIGHRCDPINAIVAQYFDPLVGGDDYCFDVVTELFSGCWTLFAACFINLIVTRSIMAACHAALAERIVADEQSSRARALNDADQAPQKRKPGCTATLFDRVLRCLPFVVRFIDDPVA